MKTFARMLVPSLLVSSALVAGAAHAARYAKTLDVVQGFNFRADKTTAVGCVTQLTIGSTALKADLVTKDPTNPSSSIACVAVMGSITWNTGAGDVFDLQGQVSADNRQAIVTYLLTTPNLSTTFQLKVYEYDATSKKYFAAIYGNDGVEKGTIPKTGSTPKLSVASTPSTQVQSPANYALNISIAPQPIAQSFSVASTPTNVVTMAWGVAKH